MKKDTKQYNNKVSMASKNELLRKNLREWLSCSKDKIKRGEMIKNMSTLLHIHEKSVGRAFRRVQLKESGSVNRSGRELYYDASVNAAIYDIWHIFDQSCAENIYSEINNTIDNLILHNHWEHDDVATYKLRHISLATFKRRIVVLRKKYNVGRGLSTTRGTTLKSMIPIYKGPWTDLGLGVGQIDTVAHCGGNIKGDYIFTVNYTDANSYWIGLRAQWCKGEKATTESLEYIRTSVPFTVVHIHPDSGSEFINYTLKLWAEEHSIKMTRSEPGHSNDNMYVEERNGHVIRKYLGYSRYEKIDLVNLINLYYEKLCLYLNFCMPVRRIKTKNRIEHKTYKTYEKYGMTPYKRIMNMDNVSEQIKNRLTETYESINRFEIKQEIDTMRVHISKVQNV